MPPLNTLFNIDIWQIVKWFYLLAFAVYLAFTLVVLRQIEVMIRTLDGNLQLPLRVIGWFLVGLAIIALVVAFIVL